ncbi:diacylglycerol kinase family protein [Alkalibaculum sp. M08DMB]|uniref:Diacylglycerol kinase family protein n=1 Tax=Alkalibaculum sporogenes TaxID=2655001 RepID=A0A6A7KCZ3_9FIRM|nr:diacylglycerol kinase family protein [Alkalibaculum sporogenes]MPW27037.1 diacylglycerol kinase family protein [Alkalibaculum sporogenes]
MKKLVDSFKFAFQGILYSFNTQRNIRIHFFIAIIVLILGIYVRLSHIEWILLLLTISIVVTSEMINTSIEKTIDLVTEEYKILAKIGKDVAAGAVLISSILSVIIGVLIFYNKIF